jgi:hypothetical protein
MRLNNILVFRVRLGCIVVIDVIVTHKNKIKSVHMLATKFTIITKMHGATHIKEASVIG